MDLISPPEEEVLLTKKGTIRKRKPKKSILYFTSDTEEAIIEYLASKNQDHRNHIFDQRIDYAFHKLAENIIHTFKFYYTDVDTINELKHEVVAFLLEKLHLYDQSKGKAFSYFSIVGKNYLIIKNNGNYAKMKQQVELNLIDDTRNVVNEVIYTDFQDQLKEFTDEFVKFYDTNINTIFTNKKDVIIADTLLELFKIRENIENFNKKALYILIRERTGLKTQNITRVVNLMRKDFSTMFLNFQKTGNFRYTKTM